jgi:hypothetical protein
MYIYRHILTWNIRVLMRIPTFVIYIKILTSFITHKRMQNTLDTALQYSEVRCYSFGHAVSPVPSLRLPEPLTKIILY